MSRRFRISLFVVGCLVLLFAVGFFFQARWATFFWPVPAGRLSHIFVSSILGAIGAPAVWIALSGETRALAAGAVDLAVTNARVAGSAFYFYIRSGNVGLLLLAIVTAMLFLLCIQLFRYAHPVPFVDNRPMPIVVRIAFFVFAVLLAIVSTMLIVVRPNTFPWPLSAENSVFYGFIFLGAMCYFLYGLLYPVWGNARGQLIGFLIYDAVLIVPFLQHFATVRPQMHMSLTIYTTVVALSGLLALYFLFLHPATRSGWSPSTRPQPS